MKTILNIRYRNANHKAFWIFCHLCGERMYKQDKDIEECTDGCEVGYAHHGCILMYGNLDETQNA